MPASFGRNLMMPVLLEMMSGYPALRLALTFNDRLIDPMEEGVDLVLRLGELQSTDELDGDAMLQASGLSGRRRNYSVSGIDG